MKYELYLVGGTIRDELLGVKSKDIDYSVILEDKTIVIEEAFKLFKVQLEREGFEIYTTKEEFLTISAKFPKNHIHSGVADFVLARKELGYKTGTREPIVVLGTLEDDLIRRDFTVNTLAKSSDGEIIDLFNGQSDLQNKILRTPMDSATSFNQDPLRILRGIRFAITKDLNFSDEIWPAIQNFQASKLSVVSTERIREELTKCFKHNTLETLEYLIHIRDINPRLYIAMLPEGLWLLPTTKG